MEAGERSDDPSRRLKARVRAELANIKVRAAFTEAGIDRAAYESARWADVLTSLLSSIHDRDVPLPANFAIRELEDELLLRLGPITRDRFEQLMRTPLLRT